MKAYQVKLKIYRAGYKSKFITGISVAKGPELARQQAIEKVKESLTETNNIDLNVIATKCELIKQEFFINPNTK